MVNKDKIVFSAIQPTGNLHIGHYFCLKKFAELSLLHSSFFAIADMHSLTTQQQNKENYINELAAAYLAVGIEPYLQSQISYHSELYWILSSYTSIGALNRMTQFKDKKNDSPILSLYTYPVLMAADILLHQTSIVPVGKDQLQHLELCQDIAQKFNIVHKQNHFVIPEIMLHDAPKIMNLQNPNHKMSKSHGEAGCLNLMDSIDTMARKIKRAQTDSEYISETNMENRKGMVNLLRIFAVLSNLSFQDALIQYSGKYFASLKNDLIDLLSVKVIPLQKKILLILENKEEISRTLKTQKNKVITSTKNHMEKIRQLVY